MLLCSSWCEVNLSALWPVLRVNEDVASVTGQLLTLHYYYRVQLSDKHGGL